MKSPGLLNTSEVKFEGQGSRPSRIRLCKKVRTIGCVQKDSQELKV